MGINVGIQITTKNNSARPARRTRQAIYKCRTIPGIQSGAVHSGNSRNIRLQIGISMGSDIPSTTNRNPHGRQKSNPMVNPLHTGNKAAKWGIPVMEYRVQYAATAETWGNRDCSKETRNHGIQIVIIRKTPVVTFDSRCFFFFTTNSINSLILQ